MNVKNNIYKYEEKYAEKGYKNIAGIDEAGRGSWAGPIAIAICILPINYKNDKIYDSKKISKKQRDEMEKTIKKDAVYYDIIFINNVVVDKLNPKNATILGMQELIKRCKLSIGIALIDYEVLNNSVIKTDSIVKGDEKSITIAAASILAKTARDRYMEQLEKEYPNYSFSKHKGYGTKLHLNEIKKNGILVDVHRLSYEPIKKIIG